MSRLALTGASGFLAQAVLAEFASRGYETIAISRSPVPAASSTVLWDPAKGELSLAELEACGRFDGVVHFAGAGIADNRWSSERKSEIELSRVRGTKLLAERLAQLSEPPGIVVSSSAIGIYGSRGDETLTEQSELGSGFLADVCRKWEGAVAPLLRGG